MAQVKGARLSGAGKPVNRQACKVARQENLPVCSHNPSSYRASARMARMFQGAGNLQTIRPTR